jgi:ketosteroid isomerase-like protein
MASQGTAMTNVITPDELSDRIAIRELIDAYAHCADRRNADGQMALFTEDTTFCVFLDSRAAEPSYVIRGRSGLAPVFQDLNQYQATTHFNGQSTIRWGGDRASGESYCIAHHVKTEGSDRTLMVASIRYLDQFTKENGVWLFSERKLMVDWIETKTMAEAQ